MEATTLNKRMSRPLACWLSHHCPFCIACVYIHVLGLFLYADSLTIDPIQVESIIDLIPWICFIIYKQLLGTAPDYVILSCVPSLPFTLFFNLVWNNHLYLSRFWRYLCYGIKFLALISFLRSWKWEIGLAFNSKMYGCTVHDAQLSWSDVHVAID